MSRDLWGASAVDLAAKIRAREVSCVEVAESVLERIAAHNGRINAIVADCSDEALRAAEQRDREVAAGGTLGPLHGVPVFRIDGKRDAAHFRRNGKSPRAG